MLSNMESSGEPDLTALRDAELARDELAGSVVFPRGHDVAIGAAVAVQVATTAIGLAVDQPWARWALAGGVLLFGLVAALQLSRFARLNGVRVGGFASKVVFGSATTASFGYAVAMVVAYAAAARDLWWLTGLAALCAGVVYVLSGRRWLRAYREEPARLGAAESALWLALAAALATAGLVLLVLEH
jgi:hypothetical protein